MYIPPAFKDNELASIHDTMRSARLSNLVTCTASGLICTPLPMFLDEREAEQGVIYGHVAKANPQWKETPLYEALAIFNGPDAYVTPSWYATKQEHGKVVPTWNYVAVHAYGTVEFFEDADRLYEIVTRLTGIYERPRSEPWAVTDAPADFIKAQLRGIVGLRMPISRIDAKRKLSQNRSEADRAGVAAGLAASDLDSDRRVATMIP
jgi:transcriptional regulator